MITRADIVRIAQAMQYRAYFRARPRHSAVAKAREQVEVVFWRRDADQRRSLWYIGLLNDITPMTKAELRVRIMAQITKINQRRALHE